MLRHIQIIAWGLVAIIAIAVPLLMIGERPLQPTATGSAMVGGAFTLTDTTGARFDSQTLKGKPFLVFFGFTHCPDICPTTLAELTGLLEELGADAKAVNTVFITVDPTRDTSPILKDYLSSFHPQIIGLTGTPDQVAKVVRQFGAYAERQALDGGNYTVDHTATVFAYDKKGELVSTLDFKEAKKIKLQKLRNLIARH